MALFMDISVNDKNEINSIVVGCSCGVRSVYIDKAEAQAWGREHAQKIQCEPSKAFEQLGAPIRGRSFKEPVQRTPSAPSTPAQDRLLSLLLDRGALSTEAVAESAASSYNTAYVNLRRMHKRGVVSKTKAGNAVLWSAA